MGPGRRSTNECPPLSIAQQAFARSISAHALGGLQQQAAIVRQSGELTLDVAVAQSEVQAAADSLGELQPGRLYRAETRLQSGSTPMPQAIEDGRSSGVRRRRRAGVGQRGDRRAV